jgi:hypothetical protein
MLAQQNFETLRAAIVLCLVAFGVAAPGIAGTVDRHPAGPDPILEGDAPGPCATAAAGADFAPGVDANGNSVAPAEGPGTNTAMGEGRVLVTVPRQHGRDVTVPVDLAQLAPPSCTPAPRSPR